jgi:hypothetical protein
MNVRNEWFSSVTQVGTKNNKLRIATLVLILLFSYPLFSFSMEIQGDAVSHIQQAGKTDGGFARLRGEGGYPLSLVISQILCSTMSPLGEE